MKFYAAITSVALAGCFYNPSYEDCTIRCTTSCPSGFECQANGFCRPSGSTGTCGPVDASEDAGYPTGPFGGPTLSFFIDQINVDDPSLTEDLLEMVVNYGGDLHVVKRASIQDPWGAPTPVVELNTNNTENGPEISLDGLTIVFARGVNLMIATRPSRTDPWGLPQPITALNAPQGEGSPSLSADGLTIVFDSNRGTGTGLDIFTSTRADLASPWSPVTVLYTTVDDDDSPMLSSDGLTLFFHTAPTMSTDNQLMSVHRPTLADPFETPTPLSSLNLPVVADEDPWVSPDGHTIYFMSSRTSNYGAIFEAHR